MINLYGVDFIVATRVTLVILYVLNLIIMMKINLSKITSVSIKIGSERSGVSLMWQQYCGTLAMLIILGGHLKPEPIN